MVKNTVVPVSYTHLFGEKERWTVDHFESKASNSPFKGWELPGKIHYTICAGKIVYQG